MPESENKKENSESFFCGFDLTVDKRIFEVSFEMCETRISANDVCLKFVHDVWRLSEVWLKSLSDFLGLKNVPTSFNHIKSRHKFHTSWTQRPLLLALNMSFKEENTFIWFHWKPPIVKTTTTRRNSFEDVSMRSHEILCLRRESEVNKTSSIVIRRLFRAKHTFWEVSYVN